MFIDGMGVLFWVDMDVVVEGECIVCVLLDVEFVLVVWVKVKVIDLYGCFLMFGMIDVYVYLVILLNIWQVEVILWCDLYGGVIVVCDMVDDLCLVGEFICVSLVGEIFVFDIYYVVLMVGFDFFMDECVGQVFVGGILGYVFWMQVIIKDIDLFLVVVWVKGIWVIVIKFYVDFFVDFVVWIIVEVY